MVNESGVFGGGVEPVLGGRARVKRMAWIFGLTVAVRIVYFLVMAPYTADWDPKPIQRNGFLSIARSVLDGEGFTTRELLTYYPAGQVVPTAARSPLPIVVFAGALWLFGSHTYYPLLLFAWCLSGVVAVCAYWVAVRASGREWIGLWTGIVFACYLSEMFITTTYSMASEPLFAACLAVYVVLLIRAGDRPGLGVAIAAGAMLGLTALSRPTVLWLPVVSMAWILFRTGRRGLVLSAVFTVVFAAVQVPWVVRNYRVFGDPIVTTTLGGFNLYRHNGMIEDGKYHTGFSHPEVERRIRRLAAASGRPARIVQRSAAQHAAQGGGGTDHQGLPGAVPAAVGDAQRVDLVQRKFRPRPLCGGELPDLSVRAGWAVLCVAVTGARVLAAAGPHRLLRRVPQRLECAVPLHLSGDGVHDSAGGVAGVRVDASRRRAVSIPGGHGDPDGRRSEGTVSSSGK